ncbi:MAG: Gfo/Idh/MocA family oxidoreductase [Phycisphaerae bacterium]
MAEKLKIGVVGLGRFVEIAHMPTYFNSRYKDHLDVAAICDVNEQRVKEWQEKYHIPNGYNDVSKMLAGEKLDAVVVVTPDHLHTSIVCQALEKGCDVLVEKPLATDIAECHKIIETARRTGRRVIADFHKREDPAHQEARYRIVEEKRYGQVQFGYVWMQDTISIPAPGFFKSNFAEKSSPVWFLGVHFFDLIRYITDLQPIQVRATGYKQVLVKRQINTFDAIKSDIIFNNGASISFCLSWNLPDGAPNLTTQGLYLQFENGELEVDTTNRGMYELSQHGYKTVNPMFTRHTANGMAGYGHESIGEALLQLLELKTSNRTAYQGQMKNDPSDINGFYATLMAQATHASLERGKKSANGEVFIGANIDLNEYINERLGKNARDYLINADI